MSFFVLFFLIIVEEAHDVTILFNKRPVFLEACVSSVHLMCDVSYHTMEPKKKNCSGLAI